jgi:phosphoenolpyruvate carboxylase
MYVLILLSTFQSSFLHLFHQVFKVASEQDPESLGAYVISQGQTASDVLAVMLLQKQFGMTKASGKLMRVVPLFETLQDLNNSPAQLERRK